MVQRLIKNANVTYIPGTPGVEVSPARPYIPERTVVELVTTCGYFPGGTPPTFEWRLSGYDALGNPIYAYVQTSLGTLGEPVYECRTVNQAVYYPAQEAVPAVLGEPSLPSQFIHDNQVGWTGRAHSVRQLMRDGTFTFTVPADTVGAVVGLSRAPQESGFADILWGFNVARGVVRIFEKGVEVAYVGPNPGAELSLRRRLGKIEYRVGGTLVRTTDNSPDPMFLAASLYTAGDSVDGAALADGAYGEGTAALPGMTSLAAEGAYAAGEGVFPAMSSTAYAAAWARAEGVLPGLAGLASESAYAAGAGVMPRMTGAGEGLGAPAFALGSGFFRLMAGSGNGLVGTVGSGGGSFAGIVGLASEGAYAAGAGAFPRMTSSGRSAVVGEVLMFNGIAALQNQATAAALLVVMNEHMEVEGIIAVQAGATGLMTESLRAEDTVLTQAELQALLASVMSAQALQSDPSAYTVWALNMTINGSTRYEDYGFNALAKIGGTFYGTSAEGLFKLSGGDDAGVPIAARINFGNLNFGTSLRKALPYVYAGMASDGRTLLKVVADGQTYFYDVRAHSPLLKEQRFELGRGLRAVYYDLTLINEGGSAFELADIEFAPVALNRRL